MKKETVIIIGIIILAIILFGVANYFDIGADKVISGKAVDLLNDISK